MSLARSANHNAPMITIANHQGTELLPLGSTIGNPLYGLLSVGDSISKEAGVLTLVIIRGDGSKMSVTLGCPPR